MTDKKRMNFISDAYPPTPEEMALIVNGKEWRGKHFDTVREAVDAAMKDCAGEVRFYEGIKPE